MNSNIMGYRGGGLYVGEFDVGEFDVGGGGISKAGQLVPLNSVMNIELALAHWFSWGRLTPSYPSPQEKI